MEHESLDTIPELPSLNPGLTLLEADEQTAGALQSLVLDHILLDDTPAFWIDSRGHATTQSLAQLAPSRRVLDRIMVARAFTAFQHYSLVEDLTTDLTPETALLVLPAIDWFYANDDLRRGEGDEMLSHALASLRDLAADHELPILVTQAAPSDIATNISDYADAHLECTMTQFGPRFVGSDFETLIFECSGGVQTTLAFWRRVLQSRHSMTHESHPEVAVHGSH